MARNKDELRAFLLGEHRKRGEDCDVNELVRAAQAAGEAGPAIARAIRELVEDGTLDAIDGGRARRKR